jgi:hypothetical protein
LVGQDTEQLLADMSDTAATTESTTLGEKAYEVALARLRDTLDAH